MQLLICRFKSFNFLLNLQILLTESGRNVMCLDSQDKSTSRCNTGGLVINFLSKYLVSIKSALVKQRQVDESRESGKTQTVQNQVNVFVFENYVQINDSHDESRCRSML